MIYKSFEANYLLSLLSSVLSKKGTPVPVRALDWRELYLLTEYHDVTGTSYYALLGLYDKIPLAWRERFSKKFHKWVTMDSDQCKELERLLKAMEDNQIAGMVLTDWYMKNYYPQRDMRLVEDIEILFDERQERRLRALMKSLGYHYESMESQGDMAFYRTVDCRFVFRAQLFAHNRKFCAEFSKIWKKAVLKEGNRYLYQLSLEDFYVLLISDACDKYARGLIDIRNVMDIYLFLKMHREEMNWAYIDTCIGGLGIFQFSKYLEAVGELWFNKDAHVEGETRVYNDMEDYIMSKGSYGRETSVELLPLINDIEIWRIQDARKAQIRKAVRWFFPDIRYMRGIFPCLEKYIFLLLPCWVLRLLRLLVFSVKMRLARAYHAVFFALDRKAEQVLDEKRQKEIREIDETHEKTEQE